MYNGFYRDLSMFVSFLFGIALSYIGFLVFAVLLFIEFYEFVTTYDKNMSELRKLASEA